MGSHSSKNMWILGISVLVVAFLGVGAGIALTFQNEHEESIPNFLGNRDVSSSVRETEIKRDTVVGRVDIDIDYYCNEDLPLCLTDDYLNQYWSASAEITGYDLMWTIFAIYQKGELKGYVYIDWGTPRREPCWTDYYTGTFYLLNTSFYLVDYIALESSYFPDGAEPLDDNCGDLIPDKEVYFYGKSRLKGCDCDDQKFDMIEDTITKLVEKGWISVYYNIPDPMDLCLTDDDLAQWTGTMYICGYEAVNGTIEIWQKGELLGIVNVEWTLQYQVPCYYDVYTATFTMEEDYIAIYSNQWPAGAIPVDPDCDPNCDTIPGKKVILKPVNLYKGCDCKNQMFLKIMAHEICILRVPNS
ncbi:MAG: hypothetical protein ACFFAS_06750 [Promethearchaeota archaeon]